MDHSTYAKSIVLTIFLEAAGIKKSNIPYERILPTRFVPWTSPQRLMNPVKCKKHTTWIMHPVLTHCYKCPKQDHTPVLKSTSWRNTQGNLEKHT
jgi:hypothetical protein